MHNLFLGICQKGFFGISCQTFDLISRTAEYLKLWQITNAPASSQLAFNVFFVVVSIYIYVSLCVCSVTKRLVGLVRPLAVTHTWCNAACQQIISPHKSVHFKHVDLVIVSLKGFKE